MVVPSGKLCFGDRYGAEEVLKMRQETFVKPVDTLTNREKVEISSVAKETDHFGDH